jgi:hypothetical protein
MHRNQRRLAGQDAKAAGGTVADLAFTGISV